MTYHDNWWEYETEDIGYDDYPPDSDPEVEDGRTIPRHSPRLYQ